MSPDCVATPDSSTRTVQKITSKTHRSNHSARRPCKYFRQLKRNIEDLNHCWCLREMWLIWRCLMIVDGQQEKWRELMVVCGKKNKNTRRNSAYSFSDTENVAILTSSGGSQPTASNVELNRFPLFGDSERHKWINKVGENLHCYLTNSPLNSDGNEQVIRHFTCVTSNIAEPNKSANFQ